MEADICRYGLNTVSCTDLKVHLNLDMFFSDLGLCSLSRFVLMCCNFSENKSMIFYS